MWTALVSAALTLAFGLAVFLELASRRDPDRTR